MKGGKKGDRIKLFGVPRRGLTSADRQVSREARRLKKLKEMQRASCPERWILPTGEKQEGCVPRGYRSWAWSTMGKKAGRAGAS